MVIAGFHECFVGKAFPRDTRETFCFTILSYLIHQVSTHYIYLNYPHIERSSFQRENPSHYLWEWEIVIPTILYTIHCGFPQLLPLHIQILERLIATNTYHTHPECKGRFWCYWEALEEAICFMDAIGLNCMIRRAREDKALLSQLVARVWRAQVHGVD